MNGYDKISQHSDDGISFNSDGYQYFSFCASEPQARQRKIDISNKLISEMLREQEKQKQNERTALDVGHEEVMSLMNRFPTKVPVIVNRMENEKCLPMLPKSKYLVPKEICFGNFQAILRNRLRLKSTQAIFLMVANRIILPPTKTMGEVYKEYANGDGYLYIKYGSQEAFGNSTTFYQLTL